MSKALLRLPYTASQITDGGDGLTVLVHPIADGLVAAEGLSERFAAFIQEHCHCRACGKPMRDIAAHRACSPSGTEALWAVAPPELRGWAQALFKAEVAHRLKFDLQQLGQRRGAHSPEEVSGLLHAQSGRCFHCLHTLLDAHTNQFHYDMSHASAVLGEDEGDGMVLVCAHCHERHGGLLTALAARQADDEPDATLRQARKAMHARVRRFKRTLRGASVLSPLLRDKALVYGVAA
ncbi:MAG: hypothetical protein QM749_17365 [Aquabacterium sp.]